MNTFSKWQHGQAGYKYRFVKYYGYLQGVQILTPNGNVLPTSENGVARVFSVFNVPSDEDWQDIFEEIST